MSLCSTKVQGTDDDSDEDDSDVEMDEETSRSSVYDVGNKLTAANETGYEASASVDAQSSSSSSSAMSVRPQIIVTPRKMASAIETATAAVLAKNRKTSLEECTTNEVPLEFIPVCVFDGNRKSGGETKPQRHGKETERTSSKTVIVRAGGSSTVSL